MKVLILAVNQEKHPYPVPPLGATYVAAAVQAAGHELSFLDLCFQDQALEAISQRLAQFQPQVVGLSIRNVDNVASHSKKNYLLHIAEMVKLIQSQSQAQVVLGGAGFSIFPEVIQRHLGVEFGIGGNGEESMVKFLEAVEGKRNFDQVPGLGRLQGQAYHKNSGKSMEFKAWPQRRLLDNQAYIRQGGLGNLQTKRGCPFTCDYCTYPIINGDRLVLRPPLDIVDELEACKKEFGLDHFFFVDDIFNLPKGHAKAICQEISRRKLDLSWYAFCSPAGFDLEIAQVMQESGCKGVEFGSDAGSLPSLQGYGKDFTPQEIIASIKACKNIKMPNAHYLIMAGPGETEQTVEETIQLFEEHNPTAVICFVGPRVYPGTKLHQRAVAEGQIHPEADLFEPSFYFSPTLDQTWLKSRLEQQWKQNPSWLIPDYFSSLDQEFFKAYQLAGYKGPLWDLLDRRTRKRYQPQLGASSQEAP